MCHGLWCLCVVELVHTTRWSCVCVPKSMQKSRNLSAYSVHIHVHNGVAKTWKGCGRNRASCGAPRDECRLPGKESMVVSANYLAKKARQ